MNMKGAMAGVAGKHHQQGNNSHPHHRSTTPYAQEVEAAREVAKQAHQVRQELQDEESQKRAQHLEELALLESQLLKYIADRVRDDSFLVREKSWVGIDVNAVEVPDEGWAEENGSVPESVEEGEEGDTKLAVAQDNDDGVEDEDGDGEDQDLKLLGDVNGDFDHHKSGEENIEDIEDDHAVPLEKLKQELVRIQDEKNRLLKGDSNLEVPSADIIIEEVRETMDADAEVEQAGGLEEPSAVSSPPPDQVEQSNKGPESEIVMKDEGENQGDLEKQSSEKEAVLELAGQLVQLRSVGNSVESITKDVEDDDGFDSIIEAPDTGLEGFVHGHHRRLDSLAARRLDFEAIDFDQFGDQPPELPLIDNPEGGEPPWDQIIGAVELPNPEEGEGERSEADQLNLHVEQMNGQTDNELEGEPTEVNGEATEPDGQGVKGVPGNMNEGSQDLITQTGSPEESEMTSLAEVNQEPGESSPQTDIAKDMLPEEPESHQGDSMLRDLPPVSEGHQSDTVDGDLDKFIFEDDRLPSELPTGGDGGGELEQGEVFPHSGPRIDLYQVTPHRDEELLVEDDEIASISSADSGSMRRSKRKMEVKYYPADEELQKRTDLLDQLASEQAKELKEISNQVVALNLQLEEEGIIREELSNQVNTLTLQLEGQVNGREELANHVSTLTLKLEEQGNGREELCNQVGTLTQQLKDQTHMREELGNQVGTLSQQLEEQIKMHEELGNHVGALTQQLEEQTRMREELGNQVGTLMQQLEEQTRIREELGNQISTLTLQLEEQTKTREELGSHVSTLTAQIEEQAKLREELDSQVSALTLQVEEQTKLREEMGSQVSTFTLQLEQQTKIQEELQSEVSNLTAALEEQTKLREELGSQINALTVQLEDQSRRREELGSQVDTLTLQLGEQSRMRESLGNQINALTLQLEEQTQMQEELESKLEEERTKRLKSETQLLALSEMSLKQDEKLKELSDRLITFTMLLDEQTKMREGKLDEERRERLESESKMSTANESLPVSSMIWSDDASSPMSFAKLLEEQKELLATQMKEAEKLQTAAEQKVGLLNHKVQDLEVISDAAGKFENVLTSKEKVLRQVLWTSFQAFFLGIALVLFVSKFQDPMRNSLRPT